MIKPKHRSIYTVLTVLSICLFSTISLAQPTLPPSRVMDVLEYEIGVEIGSKAFLGAYGGNMDTVDSITQDLIENLDKRFLHSAGIKHRLGNVIVRTDADTDPLRNSVTRGNSSSLSAFKNYWNSNGSEVGTTHDLAVYHVKTSPSGIAYVNSVGGSNRYALACGNSNWSWANGTIAHEFGHSWNLRHTGDAPISEYEGVGSPPSRFYESKPRSDGSVSGGSHVFISIMHGGSHNSHRLPTEEANTVYGIRENKRSYGDLVTDPGEIRPFGYRDIYSVFGDDPVTLDVVENDYDCNNDPLNVQLRDTVSHMGATISLSAGTGPGGRDELIYTPSKNQTSGVDFFHYTVIDTTGLTDWGCVYIEIVNPYIVVDPSQTSHNYDIGTPTSAVFSDWTRLSPDTAGDIYWSSPVNSADRGSGTGGANAANQDFVYSSNPSILEHKLANGRWNVKLNMGDASYAHDNMVVKAEGIVQYADVDSNVAEFPYVSFTVDVTDGSLSIEFSDAGGSDNNWVVNRMSLDFKSSITTPSAPDELTAIAVSNSRINLIWNDNSVDETSFNLERKEGINGPWISLGPVASNAERYDDTGLSASTEYYYRISATNSFGDSAPSAEANATTGQPPIDPLWVMDSPGVFNGSSDYRVLDKPDLGNGATELTIAVRVNPDTKGDNKGIITNMYDNNEYFGLILTGYGEGNPGEFRAMSNYIDGPDHSVPTGQWTHLVGVWKSGQIHKLYIDGVQVVSNATPPSGTLDVNEWYIGKDREISGRYFDGQIQDLKIFVRTLDENEILDLYLNGAPQSPDNLEAVSVNPNRIDLSWNDNSNNELNYQVERKDGMSETWQHTAELPADSVSYSDTGLSSGYMYSYRIYASNDNGDSKFSNETSVRTNSDLLSFARLSACWQASNLFNGVHAWWKLDDASGTTASDLSGNGYDAALSGPTWVSGTKNGALKFDGVDDKVAIPALNLNSNTITITAWIKRDGSQDNATGIFYTRSGNTADAGVIINSENKLWARWTSGPDWHSNLQLPDGNWVMIAYVIEPSKTTLYMHDGTLNSESNIASYGAEEFDGTIYLGCDQNYSNSRFFKGEMDDVKVFNSALTATQIDELYHTWNCEDSDIIIDGIINIDDLVELVKIWLE